MVNKQLSTEGNLANQRKVALDLIRGYPNPDLETIRFVNEGHIDGSGAWGASAVVTVAGKEYHELLDTLVSSGDGLPPVAPHSTPPSVTVIYSDGTSEVLE
ncbi:hypothetical protein ACRAWC_25095 [Leifsonia sp. L25]